MHSRLSPQVVSQSAGGTVVDETKLQAGYLFKKWMRFRFQLYPSGLPFDDNLLQYRLQPSNKSWPVVNKREQSN